MKQVSRKEDMSQRGQLRILHDEEGDIHIVVYGDDGDGFIDKSAAIEFCSCGMGGGKSPNTMRALVKLMEAIEMDNEESPSRAGEFS